MATVMLVVYLVAVAAAVAITVAAYREGERAMTMLLRRPGERRR